MADELAAHPQVEELARLIEHWNGDLPIPREKRLVIAQTLRDLASASLSVPIAEPEIAETLNDLRMSANALEDLDHDDLAVKVRKASTALQSLAARLAWAQERIFLKDDTIMCQKSWLEQRDGILRHLVLGEPLSPVHEVTFELWKRAELIRAAQAGKGEGT